MALEVPAAEMTGVSQRGQIPQILDLDVSHEPGADIRNLSLL